MLESYITPLLMSYVDKYIKNLKPSDLSLSLWGGDVILYNLELRLDVLEKVRVISESVISMTACVRFVNRFTVTTYIHARNRAFLIR